MLIPQKIIRREGEIRVETRIDSAGERTIIYRAGEWYRACIVGDDDMGWDGDGKSIGDALNLVREQRERARKAGY